MRTRSALVLAMLLGCSKTQSGGPTPEKSAASPASAAPASASIAPEPPSKGGTFEGKYKTALGSLYIPDEKDWSGVKWKGDDTGAAGEGKLAISIDPSGVVVSGTSTGGPLGDAIVTGRLFDDVLTATIARKDPSDGGLTGTLRGTRKGDAIEGVMRVSGPEAQKIREGSFSLTKK